MQKPNDQNNDPDEKLVCKCRGSVSRCPIHHGITSSIMEELYDEPDDQDIDKQ